MAHQDPKQEIVNRLTRLLVTGSSKVPAGNMQEGIQESKNKTLRFLKERSLPGRRVYIVVFENEQGKEVYFTCYVEEDARGNWQFRGAAGDGLMGSDPGPVVERAWANLGGGGMPDHFYAGGLVADHDQNVTRVRLIAKNGTSMEDKVEDGMVLFLSDQRVDLPIQAELYDAASTLIYAHKVLG
ncbi:hypothetical protein [Dictyobacter aurantiacus]|uniref:Uncharacterized protein n=1 Tax=Dictyobacter aurantiacus TaxID=1936993 RepID=A0A401ZF13_9CHLR|nr:hypothetical protein [Dictyobacter aurantiacus]GCE05452.1 hypothetical protein KDAU_27810 [Dictyobacter aurantiacus]